MANPPAPEQRPTFWDHFYRLGLQFVLIYSAIQFFTGKKAIGPSKTANDVLLHPLWLHGQSLDLYVYLSNVSHRDTHQKQLIWTQKNIPFGQFEDIRTLEMDIPMNKHLANNGSLYAHMILSSQENYIHLTHLLTRYKKRMISRKKNLLKETNEELVHLPEEFISYWYPNMTMQLVDFSQPIKKSVWTSNPAFQKLNIVPQTDSFLPILYLNDFWMIQDYLMPVNETLKSLPLYLRFEHLSFWKYQLYERFQDSFKLQQNSFGTSASEVDDIKRMLSETNIVLLIVTFSVSLLHSIFDFLAFKNDIAFWKNRKDTEGLSFKSILLNVVLQSIIFLYLLDNETSKMILISSFVGLLIEVWKIQKVVTFKVDWNHFPFVSYQHKQVTKAATETEKHDEVAFRYLSFLLFPLLIGYAMYSLVYEQHKSWYSFVIGTLVGFVYTFGFIAMTPQLYINYKLKSVAHMPWKTFMYKALNTFIDDLFAFIIKMPTLHRLACLRDDVIFLIYLYQRWIYPEDKTRANEFGQVAEHEKKD